jgi:hypothetical protein
MAGAGASSLADSCHLFSIKCNINEFLVIDGTLEAGRLHPLHYSVNQSKASKKGQCHDISFFI